MSFYAADENGFLGDLATNTGLGKLYAAIGSSGELSRLPKEGYLTDLKSARQEAERLVGEVDGELKTTVQNLFHLLNEATGIFIVSNGEGR
jgi:hypothetical protein